MMFRCINNLDGYCHREPNVPEAEKSYSIEYIGQDIQVHGLSPGACLNNWQTCSAFLTWGQESQRLLATSPGVKP